jgi:hypothetical protein
MRPWIIILSSAIVAIAAAAAMAWPELVLTPRSAILPSLKPLIPVIVVTSLAIYALCAILLSAGNLVAAGMRLRHHLARTPEHQGPARSNWTAAFAASGLQRLAPVLAYPQPWPARADGTVVVQRQFRPQEARREIARLCYITAARTHLFGALIVLAAIVALGLAQQCRELPLPLGLIPTIPAALILVGLMLLAFLARFAVDVTIEPLIDTMSRLPAEQIDVALLHHAVELLETVRAAPSPRHDTPATPPQIPDRLIAVLEEGHRALFAAIERLSATADGLAATTRSSVESLEATIHQSELRHPPAAETTTVDPAGLSRLHEAVVALTAVLEGIQRSPRAAAAVQDEALGTDLGPRRTDADPDLAEQLKKLLQEMETAP